MGRAMLVVACGGSEATNAGIGSSKPRPNAAQATKMTAEARDRATLIGKFNPFSPQQGGILVLGRAQKQSRAAPGQAIARSPRGTSLHRQAQLPGDPDCARGSQS